MTSGRCSASAEKPCLIMIPVHGHVKAREIRLAVGLHDINVLFSASASYLVSTVAWEVASLST